MDLTPLLATMRSWIRAMEARDFPGSFRLALDLGKAGQALIKELRLADERFGLEGWRDKTPEELLHGTVGFALAVTATAKSERLSVGHGVNVPVQSIRSATMDEKTAEHLAAIVGGEAWQSGGGVYLVTVYRDDGSLVVFSGDAISEYDNDEAFDAGHASKVIIASIPEADDLYVIVDLKGSVYYLDDKMERGWRHEEDALHEARAWESRGEGRFSVVRQSDVPA